MVGCVRVRACVCACGREDIEHSMCIVRQGVWSTSRGVVYVKGCGLRQGVWSTSKGVVYGKGCGLHQGV